MHTMKRIVFTILTLILILSSLSMTGVAFMDHDSNQKCPFAFLSSNNCGTVVDGVTSAFHHITGFKALTEVLVVSGTSVLVTLMFAVMLLFLGSLNTPHTYSNEIREHICVQEGISISILNPILRWIALHNKRNSHLDFRRVVA